MTQQPKVSGRCTGSAPSTSSKDYLVICGRASACSMDAASRCLNMTSIAASTSSLNFSSYALSDHFKSGQRLSLQNRPTADAEDMNVLPCQQLLRQVQKTARVLNSILRTADEHHNCRTPRSIRGLKFPTSGVPTSRNYRRGYYGPAGINDASPFRTVLYWHSYCLHSAAKNAHTSGSLRLFGLPSGALLHNYRRHSNSAERAPYLS
jgi:hypothetical protein